MRLTIAFILSLPIYFALADANNYLYYIPVVMLQLLAGIDHEFGG